MRRVFYFTR